MTNKFFIKAAASVAGLMAFGLVSAQASLELILDDGQGHKADILDNGPGDQASGTTGEIVYSGSLGVWKMNLDFGLSQPIVGSPTQPEMDLAIPVALSDGAGTLTITLLDTGFGPLLGSVGTGTIGAGGILNNGTVSMSGAVNNIQFANLGPFSDMAFDGETSGAVSGLGGPFTLSETVVITHTSAGFSGGDFAIDVEGAAVPEPSTICAGLLLLIPFGMWGMQLARQRKAKAV